MSTGKVKFFNETKGFGFIVEDDTNNEYFVHISGVEGNRELNEGENVKFDLEEGKRGMNAVNVKVI
ncbi:MAG: cold-shock protein [Candidatus Gracilibacteria bacterium]|nr:cold-shock protein [Candidatus Gracilibacteria bacterium]MDP2396398.1 cold-shock protein [bacterium]MDP3380302.1 cold-shock protein [bacterium]